MKEPELLFNDAECCLLGAIFQDPRAIFNVYSSISPKDFYVQKYGQAYAAMQELARENVQIDVFSVFERVARNGCDSLGKSELFDIAENSVPSAANIEHYAGLIKDFSDRRALSVLGRKIAGMVKDGEKTEDIVSQIYGELNSLGRKSKEPRSLKECIESLYEMIRDNRHVGLPTGIAALDRKITGMRPGDMIVLAAPPSVGKTALAISIANNVSLSGKTVAFFSLEMPSEKVAARFIAMNSKVNSQSIMTGPDFAEGVKIRSGVALCNERGIFIDDSSRIKAAEIRMKCSSIKNKRGALDLAVVDYLQFLEPDRRENQTIAIGDISRSLKMMAKELEVPVLCLSQLNRGYQRDGEMNMHNLRDSGNIEQDADQVWLLSFPRASEKEKRSDPKLARLNIAKNRDGEKGYVDLHFEPAYTLFTDYLSHRIPDSDGFFPPEAE